MQNHTGRGCTGSVMQGNYVNLSLSLSPGFEHHVLDQQSGVYMHSCGTNSL